MAFKFNPITGNLDLVETSSSSSSSDNFSYEYIVTGVTITIPQYQQMLLMDDITIDGELIIEGTLVTGVVA